MQFDATAIDPKKLLYFACLVESGSFRRAAARLGVTQPALGNSLSRLEKSLNTKLVERLRTGIQTTAAGDMLYSHSRMIRDELDMATRNLRDLDQGEGGAIRLGCLLSLTSGIVPKAIADWRTRFPDHALHVTGAVQFDLLNAMLRRELDMCVGFTEHYDIHDGLRQRVVFRDRLSVVARTGHPLFGRDPLLEDLADFPWVIVPPGPTAIGFETVLARAGIDQKSGTTVCNSIALLKTLIGCSDHLALAPFHAVSAEVSLGLLDILPVRIPEFDRSIAIFTRIGHDLGPVHRDLLQTIQKVGLDSPRLAGD